MPRVGLREWLAVGRAIAGGNLLRHEGPLQLTATFERRFASFMGVEHALAMTSGTVALHGALTAIGVGPGDEVIVPAYSWVASAAAPVLAGAVPVLADIDELLTIDPADIERKITPRTRAIIPVHMVNAPCNMDAIMRVARRCGLAVIEDACQAVGISYRGRMCGSIGDIGVYSFNHFKNMNIGEGGAVVTNDQKLYARMMNFHDLGIWARRGFEAGGEPPFVASHARITEIQGAMLNVQLTKLGSHINRLKKSRKTIADVLQAGGGPTISPHNDPEAAATLTVIFDTEHEAVSYASRPGAYRVFDNSKHVYTNWSPIINRRTAHPKMDPWAWADRDITYDASTCARTLDILRRSCRIHLSARWPSPVVRWKAKRLVAPAEARKEPRAVEPSQGLSTERAEEPFRQQTPSPERIEQ